MQPIAAYANDMEFDERYIAPPTVTKPKVPRRVRLSDLDTSNPAVANAVKKAHEWAKRKEDGFEDASVIFSGPYGTGKTHIAKSILWSMRMVPEGMPNGHDTPQGMLYMANDLLLRLSPTLDRQTGITDTPRAGSLIGTAPIIVIDDVGGQQNLPYIAKDDQERERHARYFKFIDACYTIQVSVIITTNLSIAGFNESPFAKHIGGRSFDRLSAMAPRGFMVGLEGVPSWRRMQGGR